MRPLFLAAGFALAASPAAAIDYYPLSVHGQWTVEVVVWDDGRMSCRARSEGDGTAMSMWVNEYGDEAHFQFASERWDFIREEDHPIFVDIDYTRYTARANLTGSSAIVFDLGTEFIEHFKRGNAIALFDGDGRRLMTYGLRGSSAAAHDLGVCWSRISPE